MLVSEEISQTPWIDRRKPYPRDGASALANQCVSPTVKLSKGNGSCREGEAGLRIYLQLNGAKS